MNVSGPSFPIVPVSTPAPRPARTAGAAAETPAGEPHAETLWDLLTPEEREFFEQQSALGPLTYRPAGPAAAGAPAPTGRRVDLKG